MSTTEPQQLWVDTLRSDRFKQGKHFLHNADTDEYCCLGVACELYDEVVGGLNKRVLTAKREDDMGGPMRVTAYGTDLGGGTIYSLPVVVRDWLGLHGDSAAYGLNDSLAKLNDEGKSFDVIAKTIEERPEGLFRE